nr:extensin-like [Penaeus vannamei]
MRSLPDAIEHAREAQYNKHTQPQSPSPTRSPQPLAVSFQSPTSTPNVSPQSPQHPLSLNNSPTSSTPAQLTPPTSAQFTEHPAVDPQAPTSSPQMSALNTNPSPTRTPSVSPNFQPSLEPQLHPKHQPSSPRCQFLTPTPSSPNPKPSAPTPNPSRRTPTFTRTPSPRLSSPNLLALPEPQAVSPNSNLHPNSQFSDSRAPTSSPQPPPPEHPAVSPNFQPSRILASTLKPNSAPTPSPTSSPQPPALFTVPASSLQPFPFSQNTHFLFRCQGVSSASRRSWSERRFEQGFGRVRGTFWANGSGTFLLRFGHVFGFRFGYGSAHVLATVRARFGYGSGRFGYGSARFCYGRARFGYGSGTRFGNRSGSVWVHTLLTPQVHDTFKHPKRMTL